ncbi:MAG: hypothetical protein KDB05_24950, partial [Planctomycetales bacterium]|nr:hypothetical protein [Planctomycetales bacterium]
MSNLVATALCHNGQFYEISQLNSQRDEVFWCCLCAHQRKSILNWRCAQQKTRSGWLIPTGFSFFNLVVVWQAKRSLENLSPAPTVSFSYVTTGKLLILRKEVIQPQVPL